MNDNEFFIIVNNHLFKIEKLSSESIASFYDRIKFILQALNMNYTIDKAITLSFILHNKKYLKVTYSQEIEKDVEVILNGIE